MPKIVKCKCPVGFILGDCPYSYSNSFHTMRDAILCLTELTKTVVNSVEKLSYEESLEQIDYSDFTEGMGRKNN